jgi:pilus assembly protein Flp/PilA
MKHMSERRDAPLETVTLGTAMRNFVNVIARWFSIESEEGVTAIEYGLMASLIALVIIAGVTLLGTNLTALFTYIAGKVTTP